MYIRPAGSSLVNAYRARKANDSAVPLEIMRVTFAETDRYGDYFASAPAMPARFSCTS